MAKRLIEFSNATSSGIWIGLSDSVKEGTWLWQDGNQTRNYTQWLPGQPKTGSAGEAADCVVMKKSGDKFGWENVDCSIRAYAMCEKGNLPLKSKT